MRVRVVLITLLLCGCVSMDAGDCRGADWYEIGFRDAIFGMQRQDDLYASQCAGHGVTLDPQRYSQGWREGVWEFNSRTPHGVD